MPAPRMQIETLPAPAKPASKSTTIVAAAVTIAFSLLGAAGVAYTDADKATWGEIAEKMAPYAVILISGITGWIGRRRASRPIAGGPADPQVIATERTRALLRQP